ncbi:MAG: TadE/TadG family type IV pilus assembly protein [Alphaproteobacteria bacterium]|jgi:Flp pilus assembly protein TadG
MPRELLLPRVTQKWLPSLRKDDRGVTAIEFAMIAPILIGMAISIYDLGSGVYFDTQLSNGAQSGAYYAVEYGYSMTGVTGAVQNASRLAGVGVSSTQFCGCPQASGAVIQVSCTATCTDGLVAGKFVQVSASKDYTPLLPYPGLPDVFHLSKQATVRLQ